MLSCHVASGNSFNASLFLFRDYPKEVDCRKPNKKKEKQTKKNKRRSTRAGRVDECCTIGGGNGTRLLREEDFVEKIRINEVDLMIHETYQTLRYVTCTIPSLTHRHPTFGFVFLASLTGFHPSTDIKL